MDNFKYDKKNKWRHGKSHKQKVLSKFHKKSGDSQMPQPVFFQNLK